MTETLQLTLAYILDLIIGDPRQLPHPVKGMGWAIGKIEGFLRGMMQNTGHKIQKIEKFEKIAGISLVMIIVGSTYGLFYVINSLFTVHRSLFTVLIMIYLTSTTLATRGLIESVRSVITALNDDDIEAARKRLSHIVGRNTERLDRDAISKTAVETLAENASDGIVAPLFYFAIGGLPLAMTYKAINTIDSMMGYKNERYRNFGWAGARLDDIANYIPARITGLLIVIASFIVSRSLFIAYCSLKTMLRDGRNHPSPNSGVPQAAMAGALCVRLGGPMYYGEILMEKPYIGVEKSGVEGPMINDLGLLNASKKAISIVGVTSVLGLAVALILQYLRVTI